MTHRSPTPPGRRSHHSAALSLALAAAVPAVAAEPEPVTPPHPYVGLWVTDDGYIRHELLPNGRYVEARGRVPSAYRGRYTVAGNRIDYVDDTGFTADGEFIDGVLYHAGMVLRRTPPAQDTARTSGGRGFD